MSDDEGERAVRAVIRQPEEVVVPPPPPAAPPAPPGGRSGKEPAPADPLPPDCPVTPLGQFGDRFYLLDSARQLRCVEDKQFGRNKIVSLFSRAVPWLYANYSRKKKISDNAGNETWVPNGIKADAIADALMAACAAAAVDDIAQLLREPGGWVADDGALVLHCGDVLFVSAAGGGMIEQDPGRFGSHIYPQFPPRPRPAAEPADTEGPEALLAMLETWQWHRPVDAVLCLGWICAAILGAALDWRPMAWITGDSGTGKSTLQKIIRLVLGGERGLIQSGDASAAGLWQALGLSSIPIALDEVEASTDNRRVDAVVKLAREAASGAVILRGGAEHQGRAFTAKSCFLFSSILIPPLAPQDRRRMAILELEPLVRGDPVPTFDPARLGRIGASLRRRLADNWDRFGSVLATYRAVLIEKGHDARGADQFGTLLACADVVLFDDGADDASKWTGPLAAAGLAELMGASPDWQQFLSYVLSKPLDAHRGGPRRPVAHYVQRAAWGDEIGVGNAEVQREANTVLGAFGLKVLHDAGGRPVWLAITNSGQGLAEVVRDTQWAAKPGASTVWAASLARAPDTEQRVLRFEGRSHRCTVVPWELVDVADHERQAHGAMA